MERPIIDDAFIISCLGQYEWKLKKIRDRIADIYNMQCEEQDFIETLQTQTKPCDAVYISGGNSRKDLSDVLEHVTAYKRQHVQVLVSEMHTLIREEEALQRIYYCFFALPDKNREVLEELYVRKKLWKEVEADLKLSHTVVSGQRLEGMRMIKSLYDSDLTIAQLQARRITQRTGGKKTARRPFHAPKDKGDGVWLVSE